MEMTKKIKFESIITNSYLISDINISDIPKPIYNNIVKPLINKREFIL